jgi:tRNA pseudouridine32 synthase/23S rRNA pseudouridine746 synthase
MSLEASPARLIHEQRVTRADSKIAVDLLSQRAGLSKGRVKDAMNKGAVWITRRGEKGQRRLRRATTTLRSGDLLRLCYDEKILAAEPLEPRLIDDQGGYSVWDKPAGLMSQGSDFGDHCALLRLVERWVKPGRQALLVHRLDREARGLVLIAHGRVTAAALSRLLQQRALEKRYRVQVRGELSRRAGERGEIERALDGKAARTRYQVCAYDPERDVSTVDVEMESGRRHQIRRHLDAIGFPVMGDPRYGRGNKNRDGLRLVASGLAFTCPLRGRAVRYSLTEEELGF